MTGQPVVSIGVPVWRGASFIGDTLELILRQRSVHFRVLISIDGADVASEQACCPFLSDPRVRLIVQPKRLGWVQNTAVVLAAPVVQGADYACVHPHDDLMEEGYLAALVDAAESFPNAAIVYSDIKGFGDLEIEIHQPSVVGSPLDRLLILLLEHFNAVAYRGLTRASALSRVAPISGNKFEDFAADTVWMARLATVGDLIRVPGVLYRKRYHSGNTHWAWNRWPRERKIGAWTEHCLNMLAEALMVEREPALRRLLMAAARMRLLQIGGPIGPYHNEVRTMTREERLQVLSNFEAMATPNVSSFT